MGIRNLATRQTGLKGIGENFATRGMGRLYLAHYTMQFAAKNFHGQAKKEIILERLQSRDSEMNSRALGT
jgi:hypothetical protein